jgi:hypothetical protein
MNDNEYLDAILRQQTLSSGCEELKELQAHRAKVESLLKDYFSKCSPTIRYGGSHAKGTMIRMAYDLDVICYFPHDDTAAGETLEDIYHNTQKALESEYWVEQKPSALRLRNRDPRYLQMDFHIDVVPGRYTDDKRDDAYLYQSSGEKKRLKTNLEIHISHVRDSGVTEAMRLLKLWRIRNGLRIKHFALELLTIKLLNERKSLTLVDQLAHVLTQFRDHANGLAIEDPSNPSGNDLTSLLDDSIRRELSSVALTTLEAAKNSGWHAVFGSSNDVHDDRKFELLNRAARNVQMPSKPWNPIE